MRTAFAVGGYHVCEKWLKDRKGRTLSDDDITHYYKIVLVLSEIIRLMHEIDKVIGQYGETRSRKVASKLKQVEQRYSRFELLRPSAAI